MNAIKRNRFYAGPNVTLKRKDFKNNLYSPMIITCYLIKEKSSDV